MFLNVAAVFLLCVAYAAAGPVNSVDCANMTIRSQNVRMEVSGCDTGMERCPLFQGQNHTVVFHFEPTMPFMNKTDFRVYGLFPKFSVPYRGKSDACEPAVTTDDTTSCKSHGGFLLGREYRHNSIFSVSNNYPKIKLFVRFLMQDRRTREPMVCKEIPVEIMSSPPTEENVA